MAIHTHYWNRPIDNSSFEFNYQDWCANGRKQAKSQGSVDQRRQSEALEGLQLQPETRIIAKPGSLIVFSAAHLHSTVPNTTKSTRFSIDFRTVHQAEIETNSGAPNADGESTGTTMGDYLRGSDLTHFPRQIIEEYRIRIPNPRHSTPRQKTDSS